MVEDEVQNYLLSAFVAWSRVSRARFCSKIKTAYQAIIVYWTLRSRSFLIRAVVRFSNPGERQAVINWHNLPLGWNRVVRTPQLRGAGAEAPLTPHYLQQCWWAHASIPVRPYRPTVLNASHAGLFFFLFSICRATLCLYLVKSVPKFGQY